MASSLPRSSACACSSTGLLHRHSPHSGSLRTPLPHYPLGCSSSHAAATPASSAALCCYASNAEQSPVPTLDVSGAVVNPVYRSTPWAAEAAAAPDDGPVRLLFVSESNVCRSVLAEAFTTQLLEQAGLGNAVQCVSKGTRDYNVDEPPQPSAVVVAEQMGAPLRPDAAAAQVDFTTDIVQYEMLLVMDKFTAADVLREVSVFDTISKTGGYSARVRRLGEFNARLAAAPGGGRDDALDIDDALYGNVGGQAELEAVEQAAAVIREACEGLTAWLQRLHATVQSGGGDEASMQRAFKDAVRSEVKGMSAIDWLVPPMLSSR